MVKNSHTNSARIVENSHTNSARIVEEKKGLLELVEEIDSKEMAHLLKFEFYNYDADTLDRHVFYVTANELIVLSYNNEPALVFGCDNLENPELFVLTPPTTTKSVSSMGELLALAHPDRPDAITVLNDMNMRMDAGGDIHQTAYLYQTHGDFSAHAPSKEIDCDGVIVSIANTRVLSIEATPENGGITFFPELFNTQLAVSAYNGDLALEMLTDSGYFDFQDVKTEEG